eukprot:13564718-Alexandrium_andersonii.AAC.1
MERVSWGVSPAKLLGVTLLATEEGRRDYAPDDDVTEDTKSEVPAKKKQQQRKFKGHATEELSDWGADCC